MEISSKLGAGLSYEVAVLAKQQQSTREQGRQAVALIEAASAPQKALPSGVGTRLDIVA